MIECHTTVHTERAAQFLFKLCKHFARKIPVEFDAQQGVAHFPFGIGRLYADDATLRLEAAAADPAMLARVCQVLEDHLQLMRRAENAALDWQPRQP